MEQPDNELQTALNKGLSQLPPIEREPFVLCMLEKITHRNASNILRIPESTLRLRLKKGMDRLRKSLLCAGWQLSATSLAVALKTLRIPGPEKGYNQSERILDCFYSATPLDQQNPRAGQTFDAPKPNHGTIFASK